MYAYNIAGIIIGLLVIALLFMLERNATKNKEIKSLEEELSTERKKLPTYYHLRKEAIKIYDNHIIDIEKSVSIVYNKKRQIKVVDMPKNPLSTTVQIATRDERDSEWTQHFTLTNNEAEALAYILAYVTSYNNSTK